jgi:hypothetical protein
MEQNLISPPSSSNDLRFQLSLLRLVYPGAASAQAAELEKLLQPSEALLARN